MSASALLSTRRAAIILWLPDDPAEGAVHALSELEPDRLLASLTALGFVFKQVRVRVS